MSGITVRSVITTSSSTQSDIIDIVGADVGIKVGNVEGIDVGVEEGSGYLRNVILPEDRN